MSISSCVVKETFENGIRLRFLWWGDDPGIFRLGQCNLKGLRRRKAGPVSSRRHGDGSEMLECLEKWPELRNGGVSRSWKCQENNLVLGDRVHGYWKHSVRHPGPGGASLQKQHWFWATGIASKRRKSIGRLGCSVKKRSVLHLTNPRIFFQRTSEFVM